MRCNFTLSIWPSEYQIIPSPWSDEEQYWATIWQGWMNTRVLTRAAALWSELSDYRWVSYAYEQFVKKRYLIFQRPSDWPQNKLGNTTRSIRLSLLSSINSQVANIMLPELMLSKQRRVHSNLKHSEFDVNDNIWTHGFSRASPHRHLETPSGLCP